jgi:hypothetical protein
MSWKPAGRRGNDPLKSAHTWAKKLSGQSILYVVPESAPARDKAGTLTQIVLAGSHGDLAKNLINIEDMPNRDEYPAAIQLERVFRFKLPLPKIRDVWPDELRRSVMQQSSLPRELPPKALEGILSLDLVEHEVGSTKDFLGQMSPPIREGYRTDPELRKRIIRAVSLANDAKQGQRDQYGELRCDVCARGSRSFSARFGTRVERAWHAHHKYPLSLGERDSTLSDFSILCAFCHEIAHSKGPHEVWSILVDRL